MDDLQVSVIQGLRSPARAADLSTERCSGSGAKDPMLAMQSFNFRAALTGLIVKPMHVDVVHVQGLSINIPPREMRQQSRQRSQHSGKSKIEVGEIVCDDSQLAIGTAKPGKDARNFELKHIVIHEVGPNDPWRYDATLRDFLQLADGVIGTKTKLHIPAG
jgi:hypothetical protein